MKRAVSALLLALLVSTFSYAAESVSGVIRMELDLSGHSPSEAAELWIPYPLSDEFQLVTDIRVEGNYANAQLTSDRAYKTPTLHISWPENTEERKASFSYKVSRSERRVKELVDPIAAWTPADYEMWLRPNENGPTDGAIAELAADITKDKKGLLAKARAIYDWTCDNTFRDPNTRGCGDGDVCALLDRPGGKCADIHSVFVSLARAAGVPAREVFGIRQGKEDGQDITTWYHCWAEFFLPGVGWVPVDPADVRKMMLKRKLTKDDPVPDDLRAAYWGAIEPHRVKLSIGRDLTLTPPQKGAPLNYLMYPYAEVGGKAIDWLDHEKFRYKITYNK